MNRKKSFLKSIWKVTFLVFVGNSVFAQNDTINQVDNNGLKQGYWIKKYDSGEKKAEGYFKDDKQIGEFRHYYLNKKTKSILKHRANSDTSDAVFYHSNGVKMGEGLYVNEKKEGVWLFYDDKERLSTAEVYKNNLKEGKSQVFYLNKKVAKEVSYKNNLEEGPSIEYYEDGTIKFKGAYKEGKLHGKVEYFHANGRIKTSGTYAMGLKHSKWVYYAPEGDIQAQEMYRYSKLQEQKLSEESEKKKQQFEKELKDKQVRPEVEEDEEIDENTFGDE